MGKARFRGLLDRVPVEPSITPPFFLEIETGPRAPPLRGHRQKGETS